MYEKYNIDTGQWVQPTKNNRPFFKLAETNLFNNMLKFYQQNDEKCPGGHEIIFLQQNEDDNNK